MDNEKLQTSHQQYFMQKGCYQRSVCLNWPCSL